MKIQQHSRSKNEDKRLLLAAHECMKLGKKLGNQELVKEAKRVIQETNERIQTNDYRFEDDLWDRLDEDYKSVAPEKVETAPRDIWQRAFAELDRMIDSTRVDNSVSIP
jgi:hypothetical protein